MDLRVFLKLDGSGFKQGLTSAKQSVDSFGSKIATGLKSNLVGAVASGISYAMVRGSLELASSWAKLSARMSIPLDKVQELAFMAEQSDTPMESIANAYSRISKSISAARGGNQDMKEAFDQLGVVVGPGSTADSVFRSMAENMSLTADETERTAAMLKVAGKSSDDLRLFLLEMGENKSKFEQNALKAMPETIAAAKEEGDKFAQLWRNIKVMLMGVVGELSKVHIMAGGAVDNVLDLGRMGPAMLNKNMTLGEAFADIQRRRHGREGGSAFRFSKGEGLGRIPEVSKYEVAWKADLMADANRAAEIRARLEDEIFRTKLEGLSVEKQKLAIQEKISKLEREAIEETYQGNEANAAERELEAQQLRTRLAGMKMPKAGQPQSDSLISVGNFLGAGRGAIESIYKEQLVEQRRANVTLKEIRDALKNTPFLNNIEVPNVL